MSGPSNLFVNAYMYAVNKAAYKVMGKGGITISRLATDDLIKFLREKGVLSDRPSVEEIKKLFIEDLAIADQLEIEEKECDLNITLRGLKISDFLKKVQEEGFEPVACPLSGVILRVCEMHAGCRLVLRGFEVVDPYTVTFRCGKIKQ
jgi:hypothetical protein